MRSRGEKTIWKNCSRMMLKMSTSTTRRNFLSGIREMGKQMVKVKPMKVLKKKTKREEKKLKIMKITLSR